MLRSSFGSFTTAQLAMRASQRALSVTGQNIANINTEGYTRQRINLKSLTMGGSDRYSSQNDANIGYGAMVTGLSQIRDPYLDRRFRNELANVGEYDNKTAALKELEDIFDKVAQNGIHTQLEDLTSMLQKLSNDTNNTNENAVKSSAEVLTKLFNDSAKQLEAKTNDLLEDLEKEQIPDINNLLKTIKELNATIKASQVHGDDALELQDQRNQKIDELATYLKIDVQYKPVKVSTSITVDKLSINMIGPDGTKYSLVNDDKISSFEESTAPTTPGGDRKLTLVVPTYDAQGKPIVDNNGNPVVTKTSFDQDGLTAGAIKSSLEMLNCEGSFDDTSNAPRGIKYYQKMLDSLVNKFASAFNTANNTTTPPSNGALDLFGTNDGSGIITAKNIKITDDWSTGKIHITTSKEPDANGGPPVDTANDNVLHMIALLTEKMDFKKDLTNPNSDTMFTGKFEDCFINMGTQLGLDIKSSLSILNNYTAVASDIADSKDNLSAVSLDEEGINLLRYQKSFNAAARLMTTLDEALNTVINNMGVVGR